MSETNIFETPPAATERPVGLVWRESDTGHQSLGGHDRLWRLSVHDAKVSPEQWVWAVYSGTSHRIGFDFAPTLEAAKAAAEACLRAWVARLNASLGTP